MAHFSMVSVLGTRTCMTRMYLRYSGRSERQKAGADQDTKYNTERTLKLARRGQEEIDEQRMNKGVPVEAVQIIKEDVS